MPQEPPETPIRRTTKNPEGGLIHQDRDTRPNPATRIGRHTSPIDEEEEGGTKVELEPFQRKQISRTSELVHLTEADATGKVGEAVVDAEGDLCTSTPSPTRDADPEENPMPIRRHG